MTKKKQSTEAAVREIRRRTRRRFSPEEKIRIVLEGEKMAPLCREFGISRVTGYEIHERYKTCGLAVAGRQSTARDRWHAGGSRRWARRALRPQATAFNRKTRGRGPRPSA